MNGVVAGPAHPDGSCDQFFFAEQLLESLLAVQVFGDQVVAGQFGDWTFTEFVTWGLGWKLSHCGNTSRVSPLAPPDLL